VRGVILVSLKNASFLMVYCFSVSSDDKLVLILFPGIPTSDPAIAAFYDKRIYKKLRLKELSLSPKLSPQGVGGGWAYHCTVFLFCHIPMLFLSVI
jgi:hypothetical protein